LIFKTILKIKPGEFLIILGSSSSHRRGLGVLGVHPRDLQRLDRSVPRPFAAWSLLSCVCASALVVEEWATYHAVDLTAFVLSHNQVVE
jgi:hypothetical protein